MADPILGLDVGGAHLKAARVGGDGRIAAVLQLACPLWQGVHHLEGALGEAVRRLGPVGRVAVTMTGELADIFSDRRTGVARILEVVGRELAPLEPRVYAGRGGFVAPADAAAAWADVASANWHATAAWVAGMVPAALLVDLGSTTTDLLPVQGGAVLTRGRTDRERLVEGELVYSGLTRTALMALAGPVPFRGRLVPLMREYFATTADVWRVLARLPEDADQHPAADGGAKSPEASARRLARMVAADLDEAPPEAWRALAAAFARRQLRELDEALDLVLARGELAGTAPLVGAGVGRFLVAELASRLGRPYRDLAGLVAAVDPATAAAAATSAPAVAVAALLAAA